MSNKKKPKEKSELEAPLVGADSGMDEHVEQRTVHILSNELNKPYKYVSNIVSTSKYSVFIWSPNFLVWKNVFEQFHKAANVYFLFISIFQLIPGLSPTGRYTTIAPLTIVLTLTLVKDAWEDWKRRLADREVNNRTAMVYRMDDWKPVAWHEIVVGDVVCLRKNDAIPADLVCLWSSEGDGLCYIETSNLDGETNLKLRKSPQSCHHFLRRQPFSSGLKAPSPHLLKGKIVCELPNPRLYHFHGYFEKEDALAKREQRVALVADNILLRGATIRNIDYVLGVAIFTGVDTKLMHNSVNKSQKFSRMDGVTNRQIFLVFVFQVVLSVISAIINRAMTSEADGSHWYLPQGEGDVNAFKSFITFMILLNALIPISLYVMLECVKLVQAFLINNDLAMYNAERDIPAVVRSSKLNEELGQVEYIFSDKTGTLTCNMMEFRKFSCMHTDADKATNMEIYGESSPATADSLNPGTGYLINDPDRFTFYDNRISKGAWRNQRNRDEIGALIVAMAVCHTVIPEKDDDGKLRYQASSPDEICLVRAAKSLGFELVARSETQVTIREGSELRHWEILNVIEFTSARKRMSIICRDPHKRLLLLTKGADNVIMERLRKDSSQMHHYMKTESILSTFAGDGLRTLVFAKSDLPEDVYKRWKRKFDAAATAIQDREEKVGLVAEEIEKDLDLLGTTAIEDKLQENVPQTIELLSQAGIKLWVLTGDKQETALNIGYACSLLHSAMRLITFDNVSEREILYELQNLVNVADDNEINSGQDLALIIQGTVLQHVLPTKEDENAHELETDYFITLATKCKSVICCRVSPMQKAQVVQAVKDRVQGVTLSIGDGANDVSMLQTAHVGIGITGLEGLQAARSSDYSFATFQSIQRLLLVHGRWNYRRIAKLVVFTFYKNMALYMTQFWYAAYNRFTGQSLYDAWALASFNLAFTSFPIMVLAVLDRDVEAKRVLSINQFPQLYMDGIKNKLFNTREFWIYTFTALIHSLMCFLLPMSSWGDLGQPGTGRSYGVNGHSVAAFSSVLLVVTAKCGLETNSWSIINWFFTFFSLYVWYAWLLVYCSMYEYFPVNDFANWYGADTPVLSSPAYWLVISVVVIASLLRDIIWKYWKRNYNPGLNHCVQLFEQTKPEGTDFDRWDVKKAFSALFPHQQVKKYKPTSAEMVGSPTHSIFSSGRSGLATAPNTSATSNVFGSPKSPAAGPSSAFGDQEMGEVTMVRSESNFFAAGARPGKRVTKISALIEEDL